MTVATASPQPLDTRPPRHGVWQVFWVFLQLGLTSFGGPVAHLGYFRQALVERRQWLTDAQYADLVALCQFLPGPASSQVGMALGLMCAGWPGCLAAWLGFTMPSAIALSRCCARVNGRLQGRRLSAGSNTGGKAMPSPLLPIGQRSLSCRWLA